ncbi:MAG: putative Ig domain-containing protein, partial [Burkholderiales bacterium]
EPATGVISGVPGFEDAGRFDIEVHGVDRSGASATGQFSLDVANVNRKPGIAMLVPAIVPENQRGALVGTLSASDPDGDPVSFSLLAGEGSALFELSGATLRVGALGLDHEAAGTRTLMVRVADGAGLYTDTPFEVLVSDLNEAPELQFPFADQFGQVGKAVNFQFGANVFRDVDETDHLTYQARRANGESLPDWLNFDERSLLFFGVPDDSSVGHLNLEIKAIDQGGESVSGNFSLTIAARAVIAPAEPTAPPVVQPPVVQPPVVQPPVVQPPVAQPTEPPVALAPTPTEIIAPATSNPVIDPPVGDSVETGSANDAVAPNALVAVPDFDNLLAITSTSPLLADESAAGSASSPVIVDATQYSPASDIRSTIAPTAATRDQSAASNARSGVADWYGERGSADSQQLQLDAQPIDAPVQADVPTVSVSPSASAVTTVQPVAAPEQGNVPSLWALSEALLNFHLSTALDPSLGVGDTFDVSARHSIAGSIDSAQSSIGAPGFGAEAQSMRLFGGLQEGLARLT